MNVQDSRPSWPVFLWRYWQDKRAQERGEYLHQWPREGHDLYCGYGLAVTSDVHGGVPYVMYDASHGGAIDWARYERISDGDIVWVRVDDLGDFARRVLPACQARFVLLTTESDWTLPDSFPELTEQVLASGKVGAWFSQNLANEQPGHIMRGVPIGPHVVRKNDMLYGQDQSWRGAFGLRDLLRLDVLPVAQVEQIWRHMRARSAPASQRICKAFSDFHLNNSSRARTYGESRQDIADQLRHNPAVHFLPGRLPQPALFDQYTQYAFVISPHGSGLDCYRTWEALWMGAIPIVKRSPIDYLYRDLPVVILDDWRQITPAQLVRWRDELAPLLDGPRLRQVQSMQYWKDQLRQASLSLRRGG